MPFVHDGPSNHPFSGWTTTTDPRCWLCGHVSAEHPPLESFLKDTDADAAAIVRAEAARRRGAP